MSSLSPPRFFQANLQKARRAVQLRSTPITRPAPPPMIPLKRGPHPVAEAPHDMYPMTAGAVTIGGGAIANKPSIISHIALNNLVRTDPVTWSLIRIVRQLISQTPFKIVPDVLPQYEELDRWEDMAGNNINDWGYACQFKSTLLSDDIQGIVGAELRRIIKPGVAAPKSDASHTLSREKRTQAAALFAIIRDQLQQEAILNCSVVQRIFDKPNNHLEKSFRSLLELVTGDMMRDDAGVVIKNYDQMGRLAELWTPAGMGYQIKPIMYPDFTLPKSPLPAYVWQDEGKVRGWFTNKELTYIMANPQGNGYGMSPVEALVYVITATLLGDNSYIKALQEGGAPGIINLKEASDPQRKRFESLLYEGMARQGGNRFVVVSGVPSEDGEFQYQEFSRGPDFQKMQIAEYQKLAPSIKALAFGFQAGDLGLVSQVSKDGALASPEVLDILAQRRGIQGPMTLIAEYMNSEVIKQEWPGITNVKGEFVSRKVDALDPLATAQAASVYVAAGINTRNEIRKAKGDRPLAGGNVATIATGNALIPTDVLESMDADSFSPDMLPGLGGQTPQDAAAGGGAPPAPTRNNANKRSQLKGHETRG